VEQWFSEVRPLFGVDNNPAAWPSERGPRIGPEVLNHRLSAYRDALGLDPTLDFHSLRRSYVTHLIEDGWDPRFVQDQVGHYAGDRRQVGHRRFRYRRAAVDVERWSS
jgi:integrase/recombinase XerC